MMALGDKLSPASIASPTTEVRVARDGMSHGTVGWSEDAARIFALPRRSKPDINTLAVQLTEQLKRPDGTQQLRPHQAWVLHEAPLAGGLLGPLAVGAGKTLIGLLMPMVMPRCQRAVLFIPPALRAQLLQHDWEFYGKHWKLPNLAGGTGSGPEKFIDGRPVLHVIAYSELSSPKSSQLLEQLQPDLIICDEYHQLKRKDAARVRRFLRYLINHPQTRVCGWSGTITSRSINDYAHLAAVALRLNSPLPIIPMVVEEWSSALDRDNPFFDAGVLEQLCHDGEDVRSGFRRRLVDTQGVVATEESALGTSLVFYKRAVPEVPKKLEKYMSRLRSQWLRPDSDDPAQCEELVDMMSVTECARQLATGFFYRWKFPKGEPETLILEWFSKRQAWNRELREKLKSAQPHIDSPKLCENAAVRYYRGGCDGCERTAGKYHEPGCRVMEQHPVWASQCWRPWAEIADKVYHETEVVWVDDFLLKNAAEWALEAPGIVWVEHRAFALKLAQMTKLPYYGGGPLASAQIIKETGQRSIIASVDANSEGKNLQAAFYRNLFITPPADAKLFEQACGRTHRPGQLQDEVEVWLMQHTIELRAAVEKARAKAAYVAETTGTAHKLQYGTWSFDS